MKMKLAINNNGGCFGREGDVRHVAKVIILSQAKKLNKRLKRVGLTVSLRGIKVPFIIIVNSIIIVRVTIVTIVITIINIVMILKVVECESGLPTMDYSIYRCFLMS